MPPYRLFSSSWVAQLVCWVHDGGTVRGYQSAMSVYIMRAYWARQSSAENVDVLRSRWGYRTLLPICHGRKNERCYEAAMSMYIVRSYQARRSSAEICGPPKGFYPYRVHLFGGDNLHPKRVGAPPRGPLVQTGWRSSPNRSSSTKFLQSQKVGRASFP